MQTVQSTVAEGGDITLDRGPTDTDDLSRLVARQSAMQQPHDEHLAADMLVRMGVTLSVDETLLLLGQLDAEPSHSQLLAGRPGEVVQYAPAL